MCVLLQEGIGGVHAMMQSLEPDEVGVYDVGDDYSVPTTNITTSVPPPTTPTFVIGTGHLLTAEVWFYPVYLHVSLYTLHVSPEEYHSCTSPNHLKAVASGQSVVMLPLILFTDDTSGNKSKLWNKFYSWCLKLASLPNKDN